MNTIQLLYLKLKSTFWHYHVHLVPFTIHVRNINSYLQECLPLPQTYYSAGHLYFYIYFLNYESTSLYFTLKRYILLILTASLSDQLENFPFYTSLKWLPLDRLDRLRYTAYSRDLWQKLSYCSSIFFDKDRSGPIRTLEYRKIFCLCQESNPGRLSTELTQLLVNSSNDEFY
jgi:hypothetical protein